MERAQVVRSFKGQQVVTEGHFADGNRTEQMIRFLTMEYGVHAVAIMLNSLILDLQAEEQATQQSVSDIFEGVK